VQAQIADLQSAVHMLVDEVGALRGEVRQLKCQPEADRRAVAEAFAELRKKFGPYFDAIPDVDAWVNAVRSGDDPPVAGTEGHPHAGG
jgi:hypothetical protein